MAEKEKRQEGLLEWFLTSLVGFISPELIKAARAAVASIPKDSWLRSESAARLTGIVRELIEKGSKRLGTVGNAIGEALADFLEFAGEELYNSSSSPQKAKAIADDWMKRFIQSSEKRMQRTRNKEDLERLIAQLEAEFEARKKLVGLIDQAAAEAAAKAEAEAKKSELKPIKWEEIWEKTKKIARVAIVEAVQLAKLANDKLETAAKPPARKLRRMEG